MPFAKDHSYFITITCLEWKHILADDRFKDVITGSMDYLVKSDRVSIYAFCIMSNHLHMIWQLRGDHNRADVQRDFLKYTGQRILKVLQQEKASLLNELEVNTSDRKYQVWERNALSIPLYSDSFFHQKFQYIHNDPVTAGFCTHAEEYRYSSAAFYLRNDKGYGFLSHYEG
jgi:putative transposase